MIEITNLEALLPHSPPMIVLDGVEDCDLDAGTLTARIKVKKDSIFYSEKIGGIPSCLALEYMAQAIACFVGYHDLKDNPDKTLGIGFIMGSRKMEVFNSVYKEGELYLVKIKSLFSSDGIASFECLIVNEKNEPTATAVVNAYRPDDIDGFMREYEKSNG